MTNIDKIAESAWRNPEGLLLLAAGLALLLRKSSSPRGSNYSNSNDYSGTNSYADDDYGRTTRSGVGKSAMQLRDQVAGTASTMADAAAGYASTAQEYVEGARDRVMDRSASMARSAKSTLQQNIGRIVEEQPLAIAVAGIAAGVAVATVFPATAVERRVLGDAGEQLSGIAAAATRKAGEAASAAGEKLKSVADEKGLNADGLQEVARDVSDAVQEALGEGETATGGASGTGSSGSTGGTSGTGAYGSTGGASGSGASGSTGAAAGTGAFSDTDVGSNQARSGSARRGVKPSSQVS
jgi:hypothetical protein